MATVLATPCADSQEIGILGCVIGAPSHVANVNVDGSSPLTRFEASFHIPQHGARAGSASIVDGVVLFCSSGEMSRDNDT